jgi:hypothetical protein
MSQVILDDVLREKLNGLSETVDICQPSGETIGHYVPHDQYVKMLYALAKTEVPLEELKRRAAEPGGMKLADFWKKMGRTS